MEGSFTRKNRCRSENLGKTQCNQNLLIRWLKFNAVGLLGVGVQLTALTLLTKLAGVHYLIATPLAVETAVLHNFVWHERYTWRDRTSANPGKLRRLFRFHLTNGLLSLVANVLLMRLLAGVLRLPLVAANALCIVSCSLANFAMSHLLVFGRPPANRVACGNTAGGITIGKT
jgi:putative flippase GtrA